MISGKITPVWVQSRAWSAARSDPHRTTAPAGAISGGAVTPNASRRTPPISGATARGGHHRGHNSTSPTPDADRPERDEA